MSFWRDEVIGFALSDETCRQMQEQVDWIQREPANPRPYYHLAEFCHMEGEADRALGLLLEAVRLNPQFAEAHNALAELYAVREDYRAAWRHARIARENGQPRAAETLERHGIAPE